MFLPTLTLPPFSSQTPPPLMPHTHQPLRAPVCGSGDHKLHLTVGQHASGTAEALEIEKSLMAEQATTRAARSCNNCASRIQTGSMVGFNKTQSLFCVSVKPYMDFNIGCYTIFITGSSWHLLDPKLSVTIAYAFVSTFGSYAG